MSELKIEETSSAGSKRAVTMEKLVNLCKRRGIVFPASEIYGGLGSTWDYGPLGIELKRNFPKSEALVLADGDTLKQVFWNFCENAVRAMKKKGGSLTVALTERGSEWEMSFSDTGPGFNSSQTEKIFEPFQSNFEGGTGLGLAIVYQIVQAHEGKVWARSEVGKGSSFVVRLRRLDQVVATGGSSSASDSAAAVAGGGARG